MNGVIIKFYVRNASIHYLLTNFALVGLIFISAAAVGFQTSGEALELHDVGGQGAGWLGGAFTSYT